LRSSIATSPHTASLSFGSWSLDVNPRRGTARTPNLAFDFDDAPAARRCAPAAHDPGLELLDELTECAILGLKVDVRVMPADSSRSSRTISTGNS
jgi:hypothetical protein